MQNTNAYWPNDKNDKSGGRARPGVRKRLPGQQAVRISAPRQHTQLANETAVVTPSAVESSMAVSSTRRFPRIQAMFMALAALCLASIWPAVLGVVDISRTEVWGVDQQAVTQSIGDDVIWNRYPSGATIQTESRDYAANFVYGFDPVVQNAAEKVIDRYRPDYAAFAAVDPQTGQILALVSRTRSGQDVGNLALRGTFPAASVFKIVTAAAVIDQGKASENTVIPFNGKSTSLYKSQVLRHKTTKWTRKPTLREAFAKSSNPVFGQLGVFHLGGELIQKYADRFGFNNGFKTDIPFDSGRIAANLRDDWSIAETASGFTRQNTISPLHGAMLAATMLNDGVMVEPYLVNKVTDDFGIILYSHRERVERRIIEPETARQMRSLMSATVRQGSAKKSFKGFFKGDFANANVGGKTGSLTGFEPKGKYDWFVGYGELDDKKIAYAALCINVEKWYVKSSYIARKVLQAYLKPDDDLSQS